MLATPLLPTAPSPSASESASRDRGQTSDRPKSSRPFEATYSERPSPTDAGESRPSREDAAKSEPSGESDAADGRDKVDSAEEDADAGEGGAAPKIDAADDQRCPDAVTSPVSEPATTAAIPVADVSSVPAPAASGQTTGEAIDASRNMAGEKVPEVTTAVQKTASGAGTTSAAAANTAAQTGLSSSTPVVSDANPKGRTKTLEARGDTKEKQHVVKARNGNILEGIVTASATANRMEAVRKDASPKGVGESGKALDAGNVPPRVPPQASVKPATPNGAMLMPFTVLEAASGSEAMELQPLPATENDSPVVWDTRGAAQTHTTNAVVRPETPAIIGRQIADAVHKMPDRPVEVSLSPEELGRVRLSISARESGITVNVLAERPETLDLMRRHIDQLAQEFTAIGYQNISFAFSQGQAGGGGNTETHTGQSEPGQVTAPRETNLPPPIRLGAVTGLDLRL